MTSELHPCPFCGGDAEYYTDNGPTGEVYGWVGCNQCDAMSCHIDVRSMQPEETHPIDAWNTRAEQAAELAKFKALAETLAGALEKIAEGTYPRPLGKPWRMDASSSKHDRCIHDAWMYETCEGCLDAFVAEALRQYKEARDAS